MREMKKGRVFDGWSEGALNFPPTYKYEMNSDNYSGGDPKGGRRTPAWYVVHITFTSFSVFKKIKRPTSYFF